MIENIKTRIKNMFRKKVRVNILFKNGKTFSGLFYSFKVHKGHGITAIEYEAVDRPILFTCLEDITMITTGKN